MDFSEQTELKIDELMERLELTKPSQAQMLKDISRAGVSIKLEKANVKFFEKYKTEVISSMWKVVKAAEIMKEHNMELSLDNVAPKTRKAKKRFLN